MKRKLKKPNHNENVFARWICAYIGPAEQTGSCGFGCGLIW